MRVTRRGIQIALGLVWVLDAALQFQPYMFTRSFATGTLDPSAIGNPGWIAGPVHWAAQLVLHSPVAWNALFAVFQLALGVGILWKRTIRIALAASGVWAIMVWWLGEGMGGLFAGSPSPLMGTPGAVLLYLVLAVLVIPRRNETTDTMLSTVRGRSSLAPRLVWSALWLSFAIESVLAPNRAPDGVSSMLGGMAAGEPRWLASVNKWASSALSGHGALVSLVLVIAFAAIAICVYVPASITRPVLIFAAMLSLAIWVVAQDFGGILTGSATDPNTGLLLVILGFAFWPHQQPRAHPVGSTSGLHTPRDRSLARLSAGLRRQAEPAPT